MRRSGRWERAAIFMAPFRSARKVTGFPARLLRTRARTRTHAHGRTLPAEVIHLCQKQGEWPGSEQAVQKQREPSDSGAAGIARRRPWGQVMNYDPSSLTDEVNAALLPAV